ncbi:MAG TPA: uracil phosphoribosyltransferase [Planctomycetota bacterium]|nr:uracil phosphoribosyltransferase [Planctomycetota bacterium]
MQTEPRTDPILQPVHRSRGSGASGAWEREHRYGAQVHILDNRFLLTALARISSPEVRHPEMVGILRQVYQTMLVNVAGREFPPVRAEVPTRMAEFHPREGVYRGTVLDPKTRVVIVDIIRAGIVPSQTCFEMLTSVLPPENVRLDHLTMARISDAAGHVVGVDLHGSKIGGSVEGAILLLPDPMGATGSTTIRAVRHYLEHHGRPARIVAMPMIATPEYLRAVLGGIDNLVVYTARLDRGLSPDDVHDALPGARWSEERGLNEKGYIVPGAGGMGEVLNNAWC